MDYNKRLDVFNPSTNQNLYYSKLRENPSYGSELPQDFTYDPGATRSIFELGYVPSGSAILGGTAFIILVVFLLTILFNKTKITLETIQKNVVIVSFILVSLGPIRLPGAFIFQTGLGLAKAGAVFGVITGLIAQRNMLWTLFSHNRSRTPLIVYISSLFVSALFITNPTFFVEDISLIIGGLIFYSAGYLAPDAHMSSKKIISGIQATILLPIGLIFLGFFLGTQTINLIGTLYPRYENIMFQFDMSRGRILSIMDIEFFAPILVYSLLTHGKVLWKYLTLSLLFIAVFFTNYRYRFITLALGLYIQLVTLPKEYSSKITRNLLGIFIVMFVLYNGMAISTGRPTIVDRFLLKNY